MTRALMLAVVVTGVMYVLSLLIVAARAFQAAAEVLKAAQS